MLLDNFNLPTIRRRLVIRMKIALQTCHVVVDGSIRLLTSIDGNGMMRLQDNTIGSSFTE